VTTSAPVQVVLRPRARGKTDNDLVLTFSNVRQAHVYMAPTLGKGNADATLEWFASAWGIVADPSLFGSKTEVDVVLAPSLVRIPQVVAVTPVLHVYLPLAPAFCAVAVRFSTEVQVQALSTTVTGWADDTPTPFVGLYLSPFGLGRPHRLPDL
jgi:hypothetical protein